MKGNSIIVQRFAPLLSIILVYTSFLMWPLPGAAAAERWGMVTIQYSKSSSYKGTFPISSATVKYVQDSVGTGNLGSADDANNSQVADVLNSLKDGDVLVINCHANCTQFGAGEKGPNWSEFYRFWNIARPPKLAVVLVHGCIFDEDANKKEIPATDAQIDAIRSSLNAKAIISFNVEVDPRAGRLSMHQMIVDVLAGNKLAGMINTPTLRYLTDPDIDRNNAKLADLKAAAKRDAANLPTDPNVPVVQVPGVQGLKRAAAVNKFKSAGFLKTPLVIDAGQTPIPEGQEGMVTKQDPDAGLMVGADKPIILYAFPGKEEVAVPAVAGKKTGKAIGILEQAGLLAGKPNEIDATSREVEFTVQSAAPAEGTIVEKNSTVILTAFKKYVAPEDATTTGTTTEGGRKIYAVFQTTYRLNGGDEAKGSPNLRLSWEIKDNKGQFAILLPDAVTKALPAEMKKLAWENGIPIEASWKGGDVYDLDMRLIENKLNEMVREASQETKDKANAVAPGLVAFEGMKGTLRVEGPNLRFTFQITVRAENTFRIEADMLAKPEQQ